MSALIEQYREWRSAIQDLSVDNDWRRITEFLKWMESQPEVKRIVDAVRQQAGANRPIQNTPMGERVRASTPMEIRAAGLELMERSAKTRGLWHLAHNLGIRPSFSTNNASDYIRAAMDQYVDPFLDYVEGELEKQGGLVSLESVAESRFGDILGVQFREKFSKTTEAFQRLAEFFGKAEGDWFNAGTSCREAMNTFVHELRDQGLVDAAWELKSGDTKGILKQVVTEAGASGRFGDTLGSLISGVWDHVASLLHRADSSKEEALRVYLWTGLLVSEVARLVIEGERE